MRKLYQIMVTYIGVKRSESLSCVENCHHPRRRRCPVTQFDSQDISLPWLVKSQAIFSVSNPRVACTDHLVKRIRIPPNEVHTNPTD